MKKQIAILGSTGSIGTQALEVIKEHADLYEAYCLTANNKVELLARQAREFNPAAVVIANEDKYDELKSLLADRPEIKVYAGKKALDEIVEAQPIDMVLTAMVGFAGLNPTIHAIKAGKKICLANKETLVAAGKTVMDLAGKHNAPILPVDSEHSAIFQCLHCSPGEKIVRIHLTASGGPFRTWTREQMASATRAEALKHPKWTMGSKITIDSATMMNKGLEIIEARWLFGVEQDRINVVVHPESIIHSMVEFDDGAIIAQMGHPDMREPIQYALGYPARLPLEHRKMDFAELGSISFHAPDTDRFPALLLAREALSRGGNMPCIMNAANEVAVAAFLQDRLSFYGITDLIEKCMSGVDFVAEPDLETIFLTNAEAAAKARELAGIE